MKAEHHELSTAQVIGARWLDDWFRRDRFTSDLSQTWRCDLAYWEVALERSRLRCARWTLEMSRGERLLVISQGEVKELHLLELDPSAHPLRFGPEAETIFSAPALWRASLLRAWGLEHRLRLYRERARWLNAGHADIYWGDCLLLASMWDKLTRPQVAAQVCQELLNRPKRERARVRDWLIEGSPICALFDPVQGGPQLTSLTLAELPRGFSSLISLISPGLAARWSDALRHELSADGFTGDGWLMLLALAKLSEWSAAIGAHALGEATLRAMSHAIARVEPARYFNVDALSVDRVIAERARRARVTRAPQAWRVNIAEARASVYGDERYVDAQLTLRYAARWEALWAPFDRLSRYTDTLIRAE